jgi:hypothetical protein
MITKFTLKTSLVYLFIFFLGSAFLFSCSKDTVGPIESQYVDPAANGIANNGGSTGGSGSTGGGGSTGGSNVPTGSSVAIGAKNTFIYKVNGVTKTIPITIPLNSFAGNPSPATTYIAFLSGLNLVNLTFDGASVGTFNMSQLIIDDGAGNRYSAIAGGKTVSTSYSVLAVLGTIQGQFYCLADNNSDKNYVVLEGSYYISTN